MRRASRGILAEIGWRSVRRGLAQARSNSDVSPVGACKGIPLQELDQALRVLRGGESVRNFYQDLGRNSPLRQGDILKRRADGSAEWLFLLTADCDIANSKHGGNLTCLSVISATAYLNIWASNRTEVFAQKACESACKAIHELEISRSSQALRLSRNELDRWLMADGVEGIIALLAFPDRKSEKRCREQLHHYQRLTDYDVSGLSRLHQAWKAAGKSVANQRSEVREAFAGISDDWFFVPHIPGSHEVGFVIDLRRPVMMNTDSVFAHETDAKVLDANENSYVRTGRFVDYIRFSVSQSFASLFARIGMISAFETERDLAFDDIVESNFS